MIPEGAEAEALTKLPIAALGLDEERAATLRCGASVRWASWRLCLRRSWWRGLGPQARTMACAGARRGESMRSSPSSRVFDLEEFCEFETPVEQIDSLLFVGARMIDCLVDASRRTGAGTALR